MKTEYLLELIKNEWADIHHTRDQEWTSLAIIGGIFYALFNAKKDSPLQVAITIFGLIACVLSIYMLFRHWLIFKSKVKIINLLEREMGIGLKFHEPGFKAPVQAVIMLFYCLLTSALAGWLSHLIFIFITVLDAAIVSILVFAVGILSCCKMYKGIKKNVNLHVWINITDEKTGEERTLKTLSNLKDHSIGDKIEKPKTVQ